MRIHRLKKKYRENSENVQKLQSFKIFFSISIIFLQNFLAIFLRFIKIPQELLRVDSKNLENLKKNYAIFPASYSEIYRKISKNYYFLKILVIFKNS